jgi:hypothetical protein
MIEIYTGHNYADKRKIYKRRSNKIGASFRYLMRDKGMARKRIG